MDKISYALGLSMGQNLMGSGVEKLNYQDLALGIEDVLTHQQPKISYQEAQQVLNQFFQELEAKVAGAAKAEGEKFLAENAKREGVKVTAFEQKIPVIIDNSGKFSYIYVYNISAVLP